MRIDVLTIKGEKTGRSVELPADVFGIEPNEHAVWLAVKSYLAAQRQGTHKAKERSEMSGSTRKLHKQKGTGGSRKGDINSPVFRGGARVFGPKPHKYELKVNTKVKRLARKSALSAKAAAGSIVIVEDFTFDGPKTRQFNAIIEKVAPKKPMFVTPDYDKNLYLSCRNIEGAGIAPATDLNTYQIMKCGTLVMCESAVQKVAANF